MVQLFTRMSWKPRSSSWRAMAAAAASAVFHCVTLWLQVHKTPSRCNSFHSSQNSLRWILNLELLSEISSDSPRIWYDMIWYLQYVLAVISCPRMPVNDKSSFPFFGTGTRVVPWSTRQENDCIQIFEIHYLWKTDELGSLVRERYPSTKLLGRNHLEFLHLGITMRF